MKRSRVKQSIKEGSTKIRPTSVGVRRFAYKIAPMLSSWQKLCCMFATPLNRSRWLRFLVPKHVDTKQFKILLRLPQ